MHLKGSLLQRLSSFFSIFNTGPYDLNAAVDLTPGGLRELIFGGNSSVEEADLVKNPSSGILSSCCVVRFVCMV